MKISEIRRVIDSAYHTRNWLTGSGIRAEFIKQDVGPTLAKKIAELKALVIAPRFKPDIERRDDEIQRCETVIARWLAYRSAGITGNEEGAKRLCRDGGPRHVFLGANKCALCETTYDAHIGKLLVSANREKPVLRLVVDNTRK